MKNQSHQTRSELPRHLNTERQGNCLENQRIALPTGKNVCHQPDYHQEDLLRGHPTLLATLLDPLIPQATLSTEEEDHQNHLLVIPDPTEGPLEDHREDHLEDLARQEAPSFRSEVLVYPGVIPWAHGLPTGASHRHPLTANKQL
jgi:hypothetical protein